MNIKIMTALMLIGIVSVAAGAGTFAYFSDTESSTGNTFTAGTFDMKIRDGVDSYHDDIGAVWSLTDLKPGDTIDTRVFNFKNEGSIAADHMEMTCDYSINENSCLEPENDCSNSGDELAEQFTITQILVSEDGESSVDYKDDLSDANGNGRKDLYDLKHAGVDGITPVPDKNGGSYTTVDMDLKFYPNAGNDFQGDGLNVNFTFTLNQHSSQ